MFATGSRDKTVKIWAQADGEWKCVATIKFEEAITAVDFAPALMDGRYVGCLNHVPMVFSFAFFSFRYLLAVGLENGQIKLIAASSQDTTQWALWANVDDRYVCNDFFIVTNSSQQWDRLCHVGVVRSLSWRLHPVKKDVFQLASGGQDHSVRIINIQQ